MRTLETAKENVLTALAFAKIQGHIVIDGATHITKDGWVPGYILTHPSIGGESGKRRKRELEAEGWVIEKRKKKDSNAYEYRLFSSTHGAQRIAFNYNGKITPKMIYGDTAYQVGIFG